MYSLNLLQPIMALVTEAAQEERVFLVLIAVIVFLVITNVLQIIGNHKKNKKTNRLYKEMEQKSTILEKECEEEKEYSERIREKYEELKKIEEKNRKLAMTDHVTGLPNRTAFVEMMDGVLKTLRKEENVAVMHIDVDYFKKVTELLGRSYGDELLIDVADRIKQVMDDNDFFACLGGDEFLVISQNIETMGEYEEKIKKIRNVFSYPFVLAAKEVFVTVSIGIAFAPKDGKTTQTIMKNLDSALYRAKSNGANQYCYYDEEINKDLMNQIELQAQLRSGIDNKEFLVYYQPQISLASDEIKGFEALIRWNHPAKGILLPAEFISTAESTGLIVTIGKWMIREVCLQLKKWEADNLGQVKVSINLSSRQFKDQNLAEYVAEVLEETEVNPAQITMEISENVALEDLEGTISVIEKLKKLGIGFSLDNFGTGYSSMNYLKYLPVDNLKIDKVFLDELMDEKEGEGVIEAMIALAKAFQLNVIAQGVESGTQESFLKKNDCNVVQGFLYSEPMQVEAAGRLLKVVQEGGKIEDAIWF